VSLAQLSFDGGEDGNQINNTSEQTMRKYQVSEKYRYFLTLMYILPALNACVLSNTTSDEHFFVSNEPLSKSNECSLSKSNESLLYSMPNAFLSDWTQASSARRAPSEHFILDSTSKSHLFLQLQYSTLANHLHRRDPAPVPVPSFSPLCACSSCST